jgi:hypothetical protein
MSTPEEEPHEGDLMMSLPNVEILFAKVEETIRAANSVAEAAEVARSVRVALLLNVLIHDAERLTKEAAATRESVREGEADGGVVD